MLKSWECSSLSNKDFPQGSSNNEFAPPTDARAATTTEQLFHQVNGLSWT